MSSINIERSPFRVVRQRADLCVVGGGMAGLGAAVTAARRGARVVLMQDRPMLGGNASSEVGVHIVGADRVGSIPHARETGLIEELRLICQRHNPQASLSVWDLLVYDLVRTTPGLTVLLNCSCLDATMDGARIAAITGWQLSTQTWQVVAATIFADCSGDAILAPLTGAECRFGREAQDEFGETAAPAVADERTMGMSHIFYTREHDHEMPFAPFPWARRFRGCDALPWGAANHAEWRYSPWWCELGGEHHAIHDSELLREELLAYTMGLWDHIKNDCVHRERARNTALDRIQFVPGRRESRRYVGEHLLTQGDIERGGHFADVVCHGGWTLDLHHPGGADSFAKYGAPPTMHHPAPSPYGIPYRCLYSRNVPNLMFAGRVASCTHVGMSSTRVMGTCCVMGQALGAAAALACARGILPHEVHAHLPELQQILLAADVYIPGVPQTVGELTATATIEATHGDPEPLRDGINRRVCRDPLRWLTKARFGAPTAEDEAACDPHCWIARPGAAVAYRFAHAMAVGHVTIIVGSNMARSIALRGPGWQEPFPECLPRALRLEVRRGGHWEPCAQITDNIRRHLTVPVNTTTDGVRLVLESLWGGAETDLYGFFVHAPDPV